MVSDTALRVLWATTLIDRTRTALRLCCMAIVGVSILACSSVSWRTVGNNDRGYRELTYIDEYVFVEIPAGSFLMGSTSGEAKELPVHQVLLRDYWIGKYPVTVSQFERFVTTTGYVTDAENGEGCWIESGGDVRHDVSWRRPGFDQPPDHPVVCVSWNDAMAYASWFSESNQINASLPTEAQWEKAARGTDQRLWPWGNEAPDGSQANFADKNYQLRFGLEQRNVDITIDDGYSQTSPVDAYPDGQSPYGVFDMAGNTIDWIYDWFDASYYATSPLTDPIGPQRNPVRRKFEIPGGWGDNLQRSIRGGAWTDASGVLSLAEGGHSIRSDMRERTDQYSSDDHLGFRLVIDDIERYPPYIPATESNPTTPTARASVMESIGGATVTVVYDRLAVNGREGRTFGESIPYGERWSPGDRAGTRITTSKTLQIDGAPLRAGTYTLFLIPQAIPADSGTWTVIFSDASQNDYNEALRVRTRAQTEDNSKEHMEYFFDETEGGDRILRFLFDYVEVHIPLEHPDRSAGEIASASVMNAMDETAVTVTYSRDVAARGQTVFGQQIPFDRTWAGSADQPLAIDFTENVLFNGEPVSAGTYFMSFVPRRDAGWSIELRRQRAVGLKPGADVIRPSDVTRQNVSVELAESGPHRLEYFFEHVSSTERLLIMAWGGANVSISISSVPPE